VRNKKKQIYFEGKKYMVHWQLFMNSTDDELYNRKTIAMRGTNNHILKLFFSSTQFKTGKSEIIASKFVIDLVSPLIKPLASPSILRGRWLGARLQGRWLWHYQSRFEYPMCCFDSSLSFRIFCIVATGYEEGQGQPLRFEDVDHSPNERLQIGNFPRLTGWMSTQGYITLKTSIGPAFFGGDMDCIVTLSSIVAPLSCAVGEMLISGCVSPFDEGVGRISTGGEGKRVKGSEVTGKEVGYANGG